MRAARLPHLPFLSIPIFAQDQDHLIFVQVCQCSLPRYIDIFQKIIHIVPNQLLGLLCASLQRAKRWGAWKCWQRLLALPSKHILLLILFSNNLNCDTGRGGLTEWRRKYSSVRHRRPHRNHHLCGALLQDGRIQHLQGSRLSSEGVWNDAGRLTGFTVPKNQREWLTYSSGVPYHPQLLCDHCCLRPRPDLQVQLGS